MEGKEKKGGGQGGSNEWGRRRGKMRRDQEGRIGKKEVGIRMGRKGRIREDGKG